MNTLHTVADLTDALHPARSAERTIGLIPTMGALHEGHLSLVRRARTQCEVVVVSVFVNPAQFDQQSDLERYPRPFQRDAELAADAGADVLFAPSVREVYPPGFATTVAVRGLTDTLEGASRGTKHFQGVSTVVTKLLCMTMADIAYFGAKDAQQVVVIRRMIADLNLPVRIEVCPTVREPDGLAMSSRNVHLRGAERERARSLHAALNAACDRATAGERSVPVLLEEAAAVMGDCDVEPEYLAIVDPDTLTPLQQLDRPALLAIAAHVGATRLIDNVILQPATDLIGSATNLTRPATGLTSGSTPIRKASTTCSA